MGKTKWCACFFFAIVLLKFATTSMLGTPQVPVMFVFGDSLVDNGNNNYLTSIAKVNFYPYGIDFFQGATGRFCNGKTVVDVLCDLLGLSYPPPFSTPWLNAEFDPRLGLTRKIVPVNLGEKETFLRRAPNLDNHARTLLQKVAPFGGVKQSGRKGLKYGMDDSG